MKPITMHDVHAAGAALEAAAPHFRAAPVVPEGWRLVPVVPTEEMLRAGHQQIDWCRDGQDTRFGEPLRGPIVGTTCKQDLLDAWSDMLSAAPTPPREGGEMAKSGDIVSFTPAGVTIGPGDWKTAPEILLDQIAAIRDEYQKRRRDCLGQMEYHAAQGDSRETGDFSTEAERHVAALLVCNRILKLVSDFRSQGGR